MKRDNNRHRSGQILVLAVLVVSLILLSTHIYIYEGLRPLQATRSTDLNNFVLSIQLGCRHVVASSLANITHGGNTSILDSNLKRWETFTGRLYQYGTTLIHSTPEDTQPYSDGTYILWGTEGFGISSSRVQYNVSLADTEVNTQLSYIVNVTTSLEVNAVYNVLGDDEKQVAVTCKIFNEDTPTQTEAIIIMYEYSGIWLRADDLSSYKIYDYGNGTYSISFHLSIPQESILISAQTRDTRNIRVQTYTTCTQIT